MNVLQQLKHLRTIFRFSTKAADKLIQPVAEDLTAIVRQTTTSTIYKHQPQNETINMRDIIEREPSFIKSQVGEQLKFRITGEESQVAMVDIYPGQKVRSESDKIIYMTEGVEMTTHMGAGFGSLVKRWLGGSSLFVTDYQFKENDGYGRVAFAETFPSKIIPVRLDNYNGEIICKRGSYICSSPDVDITVAFQRRFGAAFFGGEGFLLQKVKQLKPGQTVLLRAGGSVIKRTLRDGEKLKCAPGLVVAFQTSVDYNVETIGFKRLLNIFGGTRGIFHATFTGPGDIYLQSISFEHLVEEINKRLPRRYAPSTTRSHSRSDTSSGSGSGGSSTR